MLGYGILMTAIPEYSALMEFINNSGLSTALLIVFVIFTLKKDAEREKRYDAQTKQTSESVAAVKATADKSIREMQDKYREREKLLMSENAKREEMLRAEAEKREKMIREEAVKRENILMQNLEKQTQSFEKMSASMADVSKTLDSISKRLDRIEEKV